MEDEMPMKTNHGISLHESHRLLDPLNQPANATFHPAPSLASLGLVGPLSCRSSPILRPLLPSPLPPSHCQSSKYSLSLVKFYNLKLQPPCPSTPLLFAS